MGVALALVDPEDHEVPDHREDELGDQREREPGGHAGPALLLAHPHEDRDRHDEQHRGGEDARPHVEVHHVDRHGEPDQQDEQQADAADDQRYVVDTGPPTR